MKQLIFLFSLVFALLGVDVIAQDNNEVLTPVGAVDFDFDCSQNVLWAVNYSESEKPEMNFPASGKVKDWELPEYAQENYKRQRLFAYFQEPPSGGGDELNEDSTFFQSVWAWVKSNWMMVLIGFMGILKGVLNSIESEKGIKVFTLIDDLLDKIFDDYKKGGGTHSKPA